jgi:hypothetical protein
VWIPMPLKEDLCERNLFSSFSLKFIYLSLLYALVYRLLGIIGVLRLHRMPELVFFYHIDSSILNCIFLEDDVSVSKEKLLNKLFH